MNDRLKKEASAKKTFMDINESMNEYYIVTVCRGMIKMSSSF